jgi:hypothetical protein
VGVNGSFGKNGLPLPLPANRIARVQPAEENSPLPHGIEPIQRVSGRVSVGWKALPALALALLLASGCSTFNRDWRSAANEPAPTNSITGRWEGRWLSDANAHTGKLRCLLTPESGGKFRARFHATFWKIFHAGYTVTLVAESQGGTWQFHGEENLGGLGGGVYHYEGHASPTNFFSTYKSDYDHGTFELRRPE